MPPPPDAVALAAWFRTGLDEHGMRALCVETRLVAVKLSYSYSTAWVADGPPESSTRHPEWSREAPKESS